MNGKRASWKTYGGIMLAVGTVLIIVAMVLFAADPNSTIYGIKKLYFAIGVGIAALMDIAVGLGAMLHAKNSETEPPDEPKDK